MGIGCPYYLRQVSGTAKGVTTMTIHIDAADCSAPWRAAAAYLYTLDLDGPALAWEYLRRNPAYRASWLGKRHRADAARWGLKYCR